MTERCPTADQSMDVANDLGMTSDFCVGYFSSGKEAAIIGSPFDLFMLFLLFVFYVYFEMNGFSIKPTKDYPAESNPRISTGGPGRMFLCFPGSPCRFYVCWEGPLPSDRQLTSGMALRSSPSSKSSCRGQILVVWVSQN